MDGGWDNTWYRGDECSIPFNERENNPTCELLGCYKCKNLDSMLKLAIEATNNPMNFPTDPTPPPLRYIKEGYGNFCKICNSSTEFKWRKLKRVCINPYCKSNLKKESI